jgi:hypothetical protein
MWSLYLRDNGIAITTTSERLADALRDYRPSVELTAVEYAEIIPGLLSGRPWSIKRPSLHHENEIRAAFRDPEPRRAEGQHKTP